MPTLRCALEYASIWLFSVESISVCNLLRTGALWAEEVLNCPKPQQRSKSIDALKKCENDPVVLLAVARVFERDHKVNKARKWFNRAISLNPKLGDAWIYYYAMEYIQIHKKAMMLSNHHQAAGEESKSESTQAAAARAGDSAPDLAVTQDEDDDDDDLGDAYIISSSSSAINGTASSINSGAATSSGSHFHYYQ